MGSRNNDRRRQPRSFDVYLDWWHRPESFKRFTEGDISMAREMAMIDLDGMEYCRYCYQTLALVETKDVEAESKSTTVMAKFARERVNNPPISAYLVEYRRITSVGNDIAEFYVTCVHPPAERVQMTPKKYAEWLITLRVDHWRTDCKQERAVAQVLARWDRLQAGAA